MSARNFEVILTDRRRALLYYLFQNKVATFKQIQTDLFPNVSQPIVSRHLGRLMNDNRITKSIYGVGTKLTQVYTLSRDGLAMLENINEDDLQRVQIQSSSTDHDVYLVDLRRRISKCSMIKKYYTENELQCLPDCKDIVGLSPFISLRSDAVTQIALESGIEWIPVEFEQTQKTASRYEEKISQYYRWPEIRGVLFISENAGITRAVSELERKVMRERTPKFFHAQLSNVLASSNEITFQDIQGDKLILK